MSHAPLHRAADVVLRHRAGPRADDRLGRRQCRRPRPALWSWPPGRAPRPLGAAASRLERAYRNFLETFPFFAAAVLIGHALGRSTATSALGAQLYLWARVLYVPAYVIAIPFTRTICWTLSIVGIVLVLAAVQPG